MIRSPFGGAKARASQATSARRARRNLAGAALVVGGMLAAPVALTVGATGASAATPHATVISDCPTYSTNYGGNTDASKLVQVRFSYRPGTQSWVVPANAVLASVCIDASGAQGGGATGGPGGDVNMVPTVTANQILTVAVGKQGSGGGAGGTSAGSGGGASMVFAGNTLVAAAGGGWRGRSSRSGRRGRWPSRRQHDAARWPGRNRRTGGRQRRRRRFLHGRRLGWYRRGLARQRSRHRGPGRDRWKR